VIESAQAEGKTAAEVEAIVHDFEELQMQDRAAADKDLKDQKDAVRLLRDFDASIETGFQIACHQGPLCGEPVVGMAYILESVTVNRSEGDEDSR
jgi:ribosome assembly protein 1